MSLQFAVIKGLDKDRLFTLDPGPDLILGRGATVYYRLNDPRVSRKHCQILVDGDEVVVHCLGGSGGTLVNGQKVERQELKPGDVLQVGETQLLLQIGDFSTLDSPMPTPLKPALAPTPSPEGPEALCGKALAHYDIGPIIGQGHTGTIFAARDTKDDRPVALKVLLPELSQDGAEMRRFVRAMKTILPLRHPNLVTVYAAGKTGPYCWVAMEYVAGENMRQVIERIGVAGMLDWRYAFKVAVHVGRALEYAHAQQILHRNVTPTNILLEAPTKEVKLADLMLVKALAGALAQQITRPGELVGDVPYMSPERTRGLTDEVDGRSDLYGLGATVYALLTGRPPCEGATLVEKVKRIRQEEPEKPTRYQMSIPSGFEGVVLKLLAKRPEDRYTTAAKLLEELERIGKMQGLSV